MFHASRFNGVKLQLNFVIAFLFMASPSLAGAQTMQTICSSPIYPYFSDPSALTLGNDGNLYGTTESGGIYSAGSVFRLTPNGTLTTLASFSFGGINGEYPYAALTLGNDGNFTARRYKAEAAMVMRMGQFSE